MHVSQRTDTERSPVSAGALCAGGRPGRSRLSLYSCCRSIYMPHVFGSPLAQCALVYPRRSQGHYEHGTAGTTTGTSSTGLPKGTAVTMGG